MDNSHTVLNRWYGPMTILKIILSMYSSVWTEKFLLFLMCHWPIHWCFKMISFLHKCLIAPCYSCIILRGCGKLGAANITTKCKSIIRQTFTHLHHISDIIVYNLFDIEITLLCKEENSTKTYFIQRRSSSGHKNGSGKLL